MSCPGHAESLACHLLSQFIEINKEECESVEVILGLIPMFSSSTGVTSISPKTRGLSRRLLPQLTTLAAEHNSIYTVPKPYHMMNLSTLFETIIRPLVSDLSSYERSELHSTISAACKFLQSDLANIRAIVSKWVRANPNGFSTDSNYHMGRWEFAVKVVARPTASVVVPPSNASLCLSPRTRLPKRSPTFSSRGTTSMQSQESKMADIFGAQKLLKPLAAHTRSHSDSSYTNPPRTTKYDNDYWGTRFYSHYYPTHNYQQTFI